VARSPEAGALDRVESTLRELLGLAADSTTRRASAGKIEADLVVRARGATVVVEWKAASDASGVAGAINQLSASTKTAGLRSKTVVRIVAVPFMGETGKRLCAEAGVSWLDLSGNAWIDAPGARIRILGHPNRFVSRGRPANVFAARSSRVVRALLMEPGRAFSQADLVSVSGVDKGRVSRLARRLSAMRLIEQAGADRTMRISQPALALDLWHEAYDFWKHDVLQGHVATRSPEELIVRIAKASKGSPRPWALTGLAAAWYLTRSAMFRLTTLFAGERPSEAWLSAIGFREDARGANVWIARPIDDAVFKGMRLIKGVPCVHPLQAYLDLKAQPERAQEAATELRKKFLNWGRM
jgi:hypothetical protein